MNKLINTPFNPVTEALRSLTKSDWEALLSHLATMPAERAAGMVATLTEIRNALEASK